MYLKPIIKLKNKGLRSICMEAALGKFEIKAKHIQGVCNRDADLLSRWDSKNEQLFLNRNPNKVEINCSDVLFKPSNDW